MQISWNQLVWQEWIVVLCWTLYEKVILCNKATLSTDVFLKELNNAYFVIQEVNMVASFLRMFILISSRGRHIVHWHCFNLCSSYPAWEYSRLELLTIFILLIPTNLFHKKIFFCNFQSLFLHPYSNGVVILFIKCLESLNSATLSYKIKLKYWVIIYCPVLCYVRRFT